MIGNSNFGKHINSNKFIIDLLEKLPKLNSIDSRIVMQDMYEMEYGIHNHSFNESRPLASVAMFPGEDINKHSLLEEAIRAYVDRDIKDTYGLNLLEFLELPMDIIHILQEVNDERKAKKTKAMSEIEKQFNTK